ncbi:hypothetical protein CHS0354_023915 [Potamilus streckersoni]|uniref:long-chain-fatty-acid--CoA ligase n=1 Tax=Potamilus streckersoni TaxID=2493646 RepID=A0AAE0RZB1_9BIVA|nr:hypothetical protein CHS0354_023915 [Potamilus streckersoni]
MTKRIFDLVRSFPQEKMFSQKVAGKWRSISSAEFQTKSVLMASALIQVGLKKGDKVGILSQNRYEWSITDFGSQQIGCVTTPFYPNISKDEADYVFQHSEMKVLFVANKEIYERIENSVKKYSFLVVSYDKIEGLEQFDEFIQRGALSDAQKISDIKKDISEDDLLTIIYTSGTTGLPKGVMLTHRNLMSNIDVLLDMFPINVGDRVFSFLPLNHIFERNVMNYYIAKGANVYFAESIDLIGANLIEVKPSMMTAVPRLLEKIYLKILDRGSVLTGAKRKIFNWSLALANQYDIRNEKNSMLLKQKMKIADRLVFSKWREAVGGKMKLIASGAAPLQPKIIRIFTAAGIPIIEGYGLTETSPVVSFNSYFNLSDRCEGTVGVVISNVEVKIADDGEILVKGPNVMSGYYKDESATQSVLKNGWLHTGDVGEMIRNRFLKITDRKKELFKTSGGKYIAPSYLESAIKSSPLVEQTMVVGENENFVSALIVPNFPHVRKLAEALKVNEKESAKLIQNDLIMNLFVKEIEKVNASLNRYEQIKKFKLLSNEWSSESGELTPTFKLKRREIYKKYSNEIDSLYRSPEDNSYSKN